MRSFNSGIKTRSSKIEGIVLLTLASLVVNAACTRHTPPQVSGMSGTLGTDECVVLLHGLARTGSSMSRMERALNRAGFLTVNLDYPSRNKSIERIAAEEFRSGIELCQQTGAEQIHFVTHSLGGIIVRHAMKESKPDNLGRVVMLSPPNQGSEVTDALHQWVLYKTMNGPAGTALTTGNNSLPNRLGSVDYPVGIITGNHHTLFDTPFAAIIPGDDDGKVSVERATLEGMSDFKVVPETHTFIMDADHVIESTILFLRTGSFSR